MSDAATSKSLLYVTLASIAVNVFMAGFVMARLPVGGGMHHGFGPGEGHEPPHFHGSGPEGMHDGPPDFGAHEGPMDHGGPGGPDMPPSPFIGGALFTPQEMEADKPFMEEHFHKIRELRAGFAGELASPDLTADKIKAHFAQMDKLMDELHDHLQQKTTDKIMAMTPEERKAFAEKLEDGR